MSWKGINHQSTRDKQHCHYQYMYSVAYLLIWNWKKEQVILSFPDANNNNGSCLGASDLSMTSSAGPRVEPPALLRTLVLWKRIKGCQKSRSVEVCEGTIKHTGTWSLDTRYWFCFNIISTLVEQEKRMDDFFHNICINGIVWKGHVRCCFICFLFPFYIISFLYILQEQQYI